MRSVMIVVLTLAVVLPFAVGAQEEEAPAAKAAPVATGWDLVIAKLEASMKAAHAKDGNAVIDCCQKAIDEVQKIKAANMERVFPNAPDGWTAADIETNRMSIGGGDGSWSGVHLSRRYTHRENGTVVRVLLTDWSQLQASFRQFLQMKEQKQMLEMMGISFFEKDGCACMKMVPPEGGTAQIMAFGERRMLMVECDHAKHEAVQLIFDLFDVKAAVK